MTLIAQLRWFENKEPSELLLIFGIFFAVLALITLIYWIFFTVDSDEDGSRSQGGDRFGDKNLRSSGNHSKHSKQQTVVGINVQSNHSNSPAEVLGYSSTSFQSTDHSNLEIHSHSSSNYDYDAMPAVSSVSRIEAESYFRDDIFNSFARWDDEFGVIYIVPPGPKKVDDLTKINGISYEFQRELHRIGIFMYKQIASWPNETCRNISRELNSGDLLFRQNWPQQSRRLHFQKYGEEIALAE